MKMNFGILSFWVRREKAKRQNFRNMKMIVEIYEP